LRVVVIEYLVMLVLCPMAILVVSPPNTIGMPEVAIW
jgi:hypothetical protein